MFNVTMFSNLKKNFADSTRMAEKFQRAKT